MKIHCFVVRRESDFTLFNSLMLDQAKMVPIWVLMVLAANLTQLKFMFLRTEMTLVVMVHLNIRLSVYFKPQLILQQMVPISIEAGTYEENLLIEEKELTFEGDTSDSTLLIPMVNNIHYININNTESFVLQNIYIKRLINQVKMHPNRL